MFYQDDSQKLLFQDSLDRAGEVWGQGIVTTLEPLQTFWMGEEYHQDFFAKNPNQGYCNFVVKPKMEKTAKAFTSYLK
jgi:peptide-methionine (S)-S-oxide reductase